MTTYMDIIGNSMNEKILKIESDLLAQKIFVYSKENYNISIVTIITIANVVFQIIKFLYDWYKNKNTAAKAFKELGPMVKFFIWLRVRKEVKDRKEAKYIYKSICDLVYNLSEEEVNKLFQTKG